MTTATIAVKGSASDDFPADFCIIHFGLEFNSPARSEALSGANAAIAHLREVWTHLGSGARDMKVQSIHVVEAFNHVGPDHRREPAGWAAHVSGQLIAEPNTVPHALAELIESGVRT